MTWKSHCVANGAVALALTYRLDVALAAMVTAALPDQIEKFLPLGKHRGASHWILLWLLVVVAGPAYAHHEWAHWSAAWPCHQIKALHQLRFALETAVFGLALGPLLHVLFDGCSSAGVPVAPFSRARLRLSLYQTRSRRAFWNVSELLFLTLVLAMCAAVLRIRL